MAGELRGLSIQHPWAAAIAYGAKRVENRTWAGPAVSWAGGGRGVLRGVWVTLAGGAGLTSESDSYYARLIVGFQFH